MAPVLTQNINRYNVSLVCRSTKKNCAFRLAYIGFLLGHPQTKGFYEVANNSKFNVGR